VAAASNHRHAVVAGRTGEPRCAAVGNARAALMAKRGRRTSRSAGVGNAPRGKQPFRRTQAVVTWQQNGRCSTYGAIVKARSVGTKNGGSVANSAARVMRRCANHERHRAVEKSARAGT